MSEAIKPTILGACLAALFVLLCTAINEHLSAVSGILGMLLGMSAARVDAYIHREGWGGVD